jgi:hypothetical protein
MKKISEIGVRITTQKVIKQNTIFNVCEPKGGILPCQKLKLPIEFLLDFLQICILLALFSIVEQNE